MEQPIDAMSGCALAALKNIYQWKWPPLFVAKRSEQHVNMIGHYDNGMQMNTWGEVPWLFAGGGARATQALNPCLAQPVCENGIAGQVG